MKIQHLIIYCFILLFSTNLYGEEKADSSKVKVPTDTVNYIVKTLNINSRYSDFCPFVLDDRMYFTSDRSNNVGIEYTNKSGGGLSNIYIATLKDSVKLKGLKAYSAKVNSKYNEGPICLDTTGNTMILTKTFINPEKSGNKAEAQQLHLYISKKEKGEWTEHIPMGFCLPDYTYCHPSLSPDNKRLYFSSNLKGGRGKMDVYYSEFKSGKWSKPINLGPKVNSTANDVFPFLANDQLLYYSSDRTTGYGGLDIYRINIKDTNSISTLLEKPINSIDDDFGVYIESDKEQGYFSSNRNKKNSDDIFFFKEKIPAAICTKYIEPKYCYEFDEEQGEKHVNQIDQVGQENAIVYEWDFGDGITKRGFKVEHCYDDPGTHTVSLKVMEVISGALLYSDATRVFSIPDSTPVHIESPDTVNARQLVRISSLKTELKDYKILETSWDFGDNKSAKGIEVRHRYFKKGAYYIRIKMLVRSKKTNKLKNYCVEKPIVVI